MHRDLAGGDGGVLKHRGAVGIVLRDAIGLGQRDEALGIGGDLIEQLVLQQVALALQGEDLGLDIGILLLADGQGADHVAQRGAERRDKGRRAAAAGSGLVGSKDRDKFTAGFCRHIHKNILL